MRDYLSELDAIVKAPKDVLLAADVLLSLSKDRAALQGMLLQYFKAMKENLNRYPKEVSGGFLSFLSVDYSDPGFRKFGLGMSLHNKGQSKTVASHQSYSVLTPINCAVTVGLYSLPTPWTPEIFTVGAKTKLLGEKSVEPGEFISIDPEGPCHSFKFLTDTILLKLQSEVTVPFEWSFDIDTLEAWQSIATVQMDTNAMHSCIRAQALRDARLVEPLKPILSHKRHFVRWAAAQAICALDGAEGIKALDALRADPHPYIASATAKALAT